jgi:hypothetical protein
MIRPHNTVAEREEKLKQGLADEESRKNVNDSKFRAVAQRMDYAGFHQMVLGANLKPTKAGEVFSISESKKPVFNPAFNTPAPSRTKNQDSGNILTLWRRAGKQQKIELLERIEELKVELMKFNELGVAVEVIEAIFECGNEELARRALDALKEIKEFKGSKRLMTRKEKEKLEDVIRRVGNQSDIDFFN